MKKPPVNNSSIALDTNIFIYYFVDTSPFHNAVKKLFLDAIDRRTRFITSSITIAELLSLKDVQSVVDTLYMSFLELENMKIYEVSIEIAKEAARIRRENGFLLPDAIQLATAVYAQADVFITNDRNLKKFKEIKIKLLKELN